VWVVRVEVHLPSDSREDLKARVMAEVKAHFRCITAHVTLYVIFGLVRFRFTRQLPSDSREDLKARLTAEVKAAT
jgi:hypothetical protein